jgi:hypothetical protein
MRIGRANNQGKVGESINVEVDGKTHQAIAGNEINSSKVLVARGEDGKIMAFSESSPRETLTNLKVKRRRPKKKVEEIIYPIKCLATTRVGNKREFWLYGDRKSPEKIYELEFENGNFDRVLLENTGTGKNDWILYINYYNDDLPIYVPENYRIGLIAEVEGKDDYLLGTGGNIVIIKTHSTEIKYNENGQQQYIGYASEYRGQGYVAELPYEAWGSFIGQGTNLNSYNQNIEVNDRTLFNPWVDNLKTDLHPSVETSFYYPTTFDTGVLFPEIPNIIGTFDTEHENIRTNCDGFCSDSSFRESVESGGLESFDITEHTAIIGSLAPGVAPDNFDNYPGYIVGMDDEDSDFAEVYFTFLEEFYEPYTETIVQGHPTHSITTDYSTGASWGLYSDYHGAPYFKQWSFRIDWRSFNPVGNEYLPEHWIQLSIEECDTCFYRMWSVDKNGLLENPFQMSYSSFSLDSNLKNDVETSSICQKLDGDQEITIDGIQKTIVHDLISYGTSLNEVTTNYYEKMYCEIPFLKMKGKNSKIIGTFFTDYERTSVAPGVFIYNETYVLYQGELIVEITNFDELKATRNTNNTEHQVLNIIPWYDTLIGNKIYRVENNNNNVFNDIELTKKASVTTYSINEEGAIVKGKTTEHPVYPLKKNPDNYDNLTYWSASFHN